MNSRRIPALGAAVLLVSMGLGIVHLVAIDRLSVAAALVALVVIAALVPAILLVRDVSNESKRYRKPRGE